MSVPRGRPAERRYSAEDVRHVVAVAVAWARRLDEDDVRELIREHGSMTAAVYAKTDELLTP